MQLLFLSYQSHFTVNKFNKGQFSYKITQNTSHLSKYLFIKIWPLNSRFCVCSFKKKKKVYPLWASLSTKPKKQAPGNENPQEIFSKMQFRRQNSIQDKLLVSILEVCRERKHMARNTFCLLSSHCFLQAAIVMQQVEINMTELSWLQVLTKSGNNKSDCDIILQRKPTSFLFALV